LSLEQWDDDAALIVHLKLKQPWITEFYDRYKDHMKSLDARVFDIAGERPIPL